MLWYECSNTALSASFVGFGLDRQSKVKACAAWRVVGCPQATAMRFNDRAADAKSHAGPIGLRGKERIKDLVRLLRRQPHASITDRYQDLLILRSLRIDGEFSPPILALHCVDAIDDQVHEHLLQLHAVSRDPWDIFGELRSD